MKKFIISLAVVMLTPVSMLAQGGQLNGSGYYRVQNKDTKRYISIVDNRAKISADGGAATADLGALLMLKGSTDDQFEENVSWNPATICRFEYVSGTQYNLSGLGLDLHEKTGYYLNIAKVADNSYRLYGAAGGLGTTELCDVASWQHPSVDKNKKYWWLRPIDQTDAQYFGIKPDVQAADGTYWSTIYCAFPFKVGDGMKAYIVVNEHSGYVIIREVAEVPAGIPALIRCKGATPKENKVTVLNNSSATVSYNKLKGNFFCNLTYNDNGSPDNHWHATVYSPTTMRMLGVSSDGKVAFVRSNIDYLPACKAYLPVSSSRGAELLVVTEAELEAMAINTIQADDVTSAKSGVYTLSGQRIADTPDNLPRGLYIVNGKKVIIK